jgi:hypothetical protein
MGKKMNLRKNKPRCRSEYVAIVEGADWGVPFRVFFKRRDHAEQCAINTGGTYICLCTLQRKRFINDDWREV